MGAVELVAPAAALADAALVDELLLPPSAETRFWNDALSPLVLAPLPVLVLDALLSLDADTCCSRESRPAIM